MAIITAARKQTKVLMSINPTSPQALIYQDSFENNI